MWPNSQCAEQLSEALKTEKHLAPVYADSSSQPRPASIPGLPINSLGLSLPTHMMESDWFTGFVLGSEKLQGKGRWQVGSDPLAYSPARALSSLC